MRAFIDAAVSKPELLETLARHREEDRLLQGWAYWKDGRGCAVGCTVREFAPGREDGHGLYPELFGIPRELAHLEDAVFEGLHPEVAQEPGRSDSSGRSPRGPTWSTAADELRPLDTWRGG